MGNVSGGDAEEIACGRCERKRKGQGGIKYGLEKDSLLAMLYADHVVPANTADGVTTVQEFLAWVESEAKVAGQSAVDDIEEAPVPAPMEVEVPNRPSAYAMYE